MHIVFRSLREIVRQDPARRASGKSWVRAPNSLLVRAQVAKSHLGKSLIRLLHLGHVAGLGSRLEILGREQRVEKVEARYVLLVHANGVRELAALATSRRRPAAFQGGDRDR